LLLAALLSALLSALTGFLVGLLTLLVVPPLLIVVLSATALLLTALLILLISHQLLLGVDAKTNATVWPSVPIPVLRHLAPVPSNLPSGPNYRKGPELLLTLNVLLRPV
jgi:hypothetical protein